MNYQALNNTIKKMHERLLMKKTAVGLRLLYYAEPLTSSHRQKKNAIDFKFSTLSRMFQQTCGWSIAINVMFVSHSTKLIFFVVSLSSWRQQ